LFLASEVFKQKARGDLVQQQQYEISEQNKTRALPLPSSQNLAKNWRMTYTQFTTASNYFLPLMLTQLP